mmetsp:Transcript_28488/g.60362  ORF Transcript_28488/g.60362 Transcript_28488/m.60362 type:complete len:298 (+) Transcript_28488:74-967(+)
MIMKSVCLCTREIFKDADFAASNAATTTSNKGGVRPPTINPTTNPPSILSSPVEINKQITKGVLRAKLSKRRHLVLPRAISPSYLDELMPPIVTHLFEPQSVTYNGGVANVKNWKISCYLEVMEGGTPCTNPHEGMKRHCWELLETCNALFAIWYRQQHACNDPNTSTYKTDGNDNPIVSRLMTFITRYTPAPDENALLKHVDGAGKVDGSMVLALPIDRWTASKEENSFEGHGGGLTFWDGKMRKNTESGKREPEEIVYDTRSGDLAFIDRAVWHQANPITRGTRWALVIFYKVER